MNNLNYYVIVHTRTIPQYAATSQRCMKITESNALNKWDEYYKNLGDSFLFPNEFVVRSFLGQYPNLKTPKDKAGKKVCDIGCGDGRNLTALHKLKFKLYASEISETICEITKNKLLNHSDRINVDIRKGLNWELPFEDNFFDYALSWNACYYMKDEYSSIQDHIAEHARILKSDGYLIVSVPTPSCFSLQGAENIGNNLIRINTNSKWNMLNGTIYYKFDSYQHVEKEFGTHFYNFQKALISDDCFGLKLEYFVFVCQKK